MKRPFDFAVAVVATLFLSVPILILALAVRLTSPGPALYWSDRVGRHNRIFKMPKFRSMRIDTPAVATHLLQNPEQWLTPIGSFLRKSSLDELPQLWSILKGDMSLVGPRPLLMEYLPLYSPQQAHRHEVRPGITGWAQVNGRNAISWADKFALDVWYVDHRNLWLDVQILWRTVRKVLLRDGISAAGEATMPAFTGSEPGNQSEEKL